MPETPWINRTKFQKLFAERFCEVRGYGCNSAQQNWQGDRRGRADISQHNVSIHGIL
jgi:hypothetical protein